LPDLSGGIFNAIENIGAAVETKTTMPIVAQWLARGMLCDTTSLPSRGLETTDLSMYGFGEKFPFHTEYVPLDCTFMMPLTLGDNALPRFLNYWQNYIQSGQEGPESGMDFRFPSEYYGSIILAMFDRKNEPTIVYKFTNIYPVTVQSVPVSWEQSNEYLKCAVTFNYSSWKILSRADREVLAILAASIIGQA
jgi:hypothetical protein